tara:strand:+ start:1032 stop:2024 length:993 start_codon:yes stop_codon:yes gene_type:complete
METNFTQKNPSYFCKKCDFITNNKKDYSRHILTLKHKRKHFQDFDEKKTLFVCKNCSKTYISRSGLYKHSKKCQEIDVDTTSKCFHSKNIENSSNKKNEKKNEISSKNLKSEVSDFQKTKQKDENKQMYSLIMKQGEILESLIKKISDTPNNNTTNNNTTNNNTFNNSNNTTNQINLNVYLNDTCKEADNLPQFIDNIRLQLSDLISVKNEGLLNSTKNIILKELQNTEQFKRPIQCTDIKRKTLYVKEEGEWSKDVGNEKLKGAIRSLSQKHIPLVKNLVCQEGDKTLNSEDYIHVVKSATTDVLEETRGLQSAVREICQETYMKGGVE